MPDNDGDYKTIRIPVELENEISGLIGKKGFRSKAEIVKEALRRMLQEYSEIPVLEHFNLNEDGVRILDRSMNKIVDIFFKPNGIRCDYCEASDCRHIQFALTVPAIKDVVKRKRGEGWRLPEGREVTMCGSPLTMLSNLMESAITRYIAILSNLMESDNIRRMGKNKIEFCKWFCNIKSCITPYILPFVRASRS